MGVGSLTVIECRTPGQVLPSNQTNQRLRHSTRETFSSVKLACISYVAVCFFTSVQCIWEKWAYCPFHLKVRKQRFSTKRCIACLLVLPWMQLCSVGWGMSSPAPGTLWLSSSHPRQTRSKECCRPASHSIGWSVPAEAMHWRPEDRNKLETCKRKQVM